MWLFLFSEALLFGGLFLLYAVYRAAHAAAFHTAAAELDAVLGAANTVLLLTSSLTMALAVAALERGRRGSAASLLAVTALCGLLFLGVKWGEWGGKIRHGIYPGSAEMLRRYESGETLFFGLYFAMTGLHALHVLAGAAAVGAAAVLVGRGPVRSVRVDGEDGIESVTIRIRYRGAPPAASAGLRTFVENVGLYWHLVDVVWIYLFPLLYLIT